MNSNDVQEVMVSFRMRHGTSKHFSISMGEWCMFADSFRLAYLLLLAHIKDLPEQYVQAYTEEVHSLIDYMQELSGPETYAILMDRLDAFGHDNFGEEP